MDQPQPEKTLEDLAGNPRNPRSISAKKYTSLKSTLVEFGDLSGIVYNVRTGQLVGGHMRKKAFLELQGNAPIVIQSRYQVPSAVGTTALGYVELKGERYTYREVDWPAEKEASANIAANESGGTTDDDKLAEIIADINSLQDEKLLELTSLSAKKISNLLQSSSEPEAFGTPELTHSNMTFSVTAEQSEIINQALSRVLQHENILGMNKEQKYGHGLAMICAHYLAQTQPADFGENLNEIPQ